MPPNHFNLEASKAILRKASTELVGLVIVGDSTSHYTNERMPGSVFRCWDVQWARLGIDGAGGNGFAGDGISAVVSSLGDVDRSILSPGQSPSVAPAGLTNRYPVSMAIQWGQADAPNTLYAGSAATHIVTAGYDMYSSEAGAMSGNFYRGFPALGRTITGTRLCAITDNSGNWLGNTIAFDYNAEVNFPWVASATHLSQAGSTANPEIIVREVTGPGTLGTRASVGIYFPFEERVTPGYPNKGIGWVGHYIKFAGEIGLHMGVIAQPSWALSDHLPETVYSASDNTDWKYDEDYVAEWFQKYMNCTKVLIRWQVGINPTQAPLDAVIEPDAATWRVSTSVAIDRLVQAFQAGGATEIVVQLCSFWGHSTEDGVRTLAWNEQLRILAEELDGTDGVRWTFYDQLGELQAGGYTTGTANTALKSEYRAAADTIHQNFDGMMLLGRLEWNAINPYTAPTRDTRMGSRRGLGPR